MDEKLFRARICKDLLPVYDACAGFDLKNLDAFVKATTVAEMAAMRDEPEVHVYEKMIRGQTNCPDIKLRIYEPMGRTELLPGMLFFHGGGFVFGSVYRQESLCQRYCKQTQSVIVSVDYRLAPKWRAPAGAEDGYAAFCWVDKNGESIGVDTSRVGLIGLSGGGNICAAVTLMTRDRQGPKPLISMPLYAELDHRFITKSSREIDSLKVWSYPYSLLSWEYNLMPGEEPNYYVNPSLCEDLSGLPPTFSYVGGLDPFRDENLDYWNRLMAMNVDVECHIYPGCFHGFDLSVPDSVYGFMAFRETCAFICRTMKTQFQDMAVAETNAFGGTPA